MCAWHPVPETGGPRMGSRSRSRRSWAPAQPQFEGTGSLVIRPRGRGVLGRASGIRRAALLTLWHERSGTDSAR